MNAELQVLQKFKDSFAAGRLGHAYLIVGDPRGGAARLAENILQMLFCLGGAKRPCGECNNCRRIEKRLHPDVMRIEPIKKSRGILVEQIEEVLKHTFQTTFEGGWKAVLLVNAERMNNEAANKLLKTLEEPPPGTVFLLLTDQPEALLPTIVSRCQRIALPDFLVESEDSLQSEVLATAAGMGSGRITERLRKAREMIALLKKIREQVEAETSEWTAQIQSDGEIDEDMEKIIQGRIEAEYRERRRHVLRLLLLWQRDLLFKANKLDDDLLFFRSAADKIRETAGQLTNSQAMDNMSIIENMHAHFNQYLPEALVIERAFMQLSTGKGKGHASSASH